MAESNHLTPQQAMIQESLARRAIAYEQTKTVGIFLRRMNEILQELETIAPQSGVVYWIEKHPIMIMMAYKLKGMILTDPDISYIKAKAMVEDMANV